MNTMYDLFKFLHLIGVVFMSIPLFNLIVVNERASLGPTFQYYADRYMENIIRRGAYRCFVFQSTVLASGILLLLLGPLGLQSIWTNWLILAKTVLLFVLMGLLSYVHLHLQPNIELLLAHLGPDSVVPEDLMTQLKPLRLRRKRLATFCLFILITIIIFGVQVNAPFDSLLTIALIALAALFSWRANKTLLRFGWI